VSGPGTSAWPGLPDVTTIRRWGLQGATSVLDQAVFSGTNFLTQILLARWLSPDEYGAIAVSFVVILFLSGFHSAFVLEPMSVFGPAEHVEDLGSYIKSHLRIHLGLTGLFGLVLILGGIAAQSLLRVTSPLPAALIGAGIALPFVLWVWLARRSAYVVRHPKLALQGSLAYFGLHVALLGAARLNGWIAVSPMVPYLLMALASLIAGMVTWMLVLRPLRGPADLSPYSSREILRENWHYGKWGAGSGILNSTAGQLQTVALAFAGLAEAAGLRAMQNFMLPMAQAITSIAQMALPALARDFGEGDLSKLKQKGILTSVTLTLMAASYAVLLLVFHRPLEQLAYGGKFASYSGLIPLLGLVPVLSGFATGISLILRAVRWPQHALYVTIASGSTGLITAILLTWAYGIIGAAVSIVVSYAVAAAAALVLFLWRKDRLLPGG
jgi:O-antigen/teichoic acid export membrane protein